MSAKENAKQAWKEILGTAGTDENGDQKKNEEEKTSFERSKPSGFSGLTGSVGAKSYPVSVISEGMTINGNISVKGDLELRGSLKGNVKGEGSILVSGKQLGNMECAKDLTLSMAAIQGNVKSQGTINIDKESVVVGDVVADNAIIDGKVKGSLDVKETVTFQKDAVLMGDVSANVISMSEGAQIAGKVKTKGASIPPVKFDEEFLEFEKEKKVELKPEP